MNFVEPSIIQLQFQALNKFCSVFNDMMKDFDLKLYFYPYGGCLYRYFMPNSTSEFTRTNDMDGFLVVMPSNLTQTECLSGETQKVKDAYKVLFSSLFNKDKVNVLREWCESSSDVWGLSLHTLINALNSEDAEPQFESMLRYPFDVFDPQRLQPNGFQSIFSDPFPLHFKYGDYDDFLDLHFGVLQPINDNPSARVHEIVATATQHEEFRNVYIQSRQTFFVEQIRTVIETLRVLYDNTLLNPEIQDGFTIKPNGIIQAIKKSKKRLMRVFELVFNSQSLGQKTLEQIYGIHNTDVFAPYLQKKIGQWNNSDLQLFLQPLILKKEVNNFNQMLKYGFEGFRQKESKYDTESELATAIAKPLTQAMQMLNVRVGNTASNAFLVAEDARIIDVMYLLRYMYDRLADKVEASPVKLRF
jgi:hypothetical protein